MAESPAGKSGRDGNCNRVGKMHQVLKGLIFFFMLLIPAEGLAQVFDSLEAGKSVVKIVVYRGNNVWREGSGFVVGADGAIVTNLHLLDRGNRTVVVSLESGEEYEAEVVGSERDRDIVVLKAEGFGAPPLTFSIRPLEEGDSLISLGLFDESGISMGALTLDLSPGSVGSLEGIDIGDVEGLAFLIHNGLITRGGYGGPLVNRCGQVVGMNRPDPGLSRSRVRRGVDPDQAVYALLGSVVADYLEELEIEIALAPVICLTEVEKAEEEKIKAEEDKRRAEEGAALAREKAAEAAKEAAEAAKRADELEKKAQEAQKAAEISEEDKLKALAAARRARAEAEQKAREASALEIRARELEEKRIEAEELAKQARQAEARSRQRLFIGLAIAAAAILILLLVSSVMIRRRSQAVDEVQGEIEAVRVEAAMAKAEAAASVRSEWNDCLLEGATTSLKLPGTTLPADVGGVVVGRHPTMSTVVFDHAEISRSHARFYVSGGVVYVEDLDSKNRTLINGRELAPHSPEVIKDGDEVAFGRHTFIFRILR